MKVLCPACEGMARARSFRVDGSALFLTCARCGVESAVEVTEPAASPAQPPALAQPPPTVRPPEPTPLHSLSMPLPVSRPTAVPDAPDGVDEGSPSPSAPPAQVASPARVVTLRQVGDAVQLAAEAAASADPFAVPDDRCPKCVGRRPKDALFCPHCGLAWPNFRPEQVAVTEALAAAFRHAMAAWDDWSRHDAVLALAARTGQLPALGRLYRLRLVAAPLDPVAQRGRDEVLRRASAGAELLRSRPPSETTGGRMMRSAAVLLGGLLLLVVAAVAFRMMLA